MADPARLAELERLRNAAKWQRYRQRRAGLLAQVPRCENCGGRILQEQPQADLCSACWLVTPEGRAATAERSRRYRQQWRL